LDYADIAERGKSLPDPLTLGGSRLVIHIQTDPKAVDSFLALLVQLAKEKQAAGFVPPPVANGVSKGTYKEIYVRKKV
jgi:threonine aldolase